MTTEETVSVPHHVEDAVATIAAIHAAHYREARALQKAVSRATGGIAQPFTLILITAGIASWGRSITFLPSSDARRSIRFHSRCWLPPFRPPPSTLPQ